MAQNAPAQEQRHGAAGQTGRQTAIGHVAGGAGEQAAGHAGQSAEPGAGQARRTGQDACGQAGRVRRSGALNGRQERFVAEYRKDGNAAQAAVRAGYARGSAAGLLRHPGVRERLEGGVPDGPSSPAFPEQGAAVCPAFPVGSSQAFPEAAASGCSANPDFPEQATSACAASPSRTDVPFTGPAASACAAFPEQATSFCLSSPDFPDAGRAGEACARDVSGSASDSGAPRGAAELSGSGICEMPVDNLPDQHGGGGVSAGSLADDFKPQRIRAAEGAPPDGFARRLAARAGAGAAVLFFRILQLLHNTTRRGRCSRSARRRFPSGSGPCRRGFPATTQSARR